MVSELRRGRTALAPWGVALIAGVAGCSGVLGLEEWSDPPLAGAGGSDATSSSSGPGGADKEAGGGGGGGGGAGTTTTTTTSTTTSTSTETGTLGSFGSCADGELSGDETDVDCGGDSCWPCDIGLHCLNDADCSSGNCGGAGLCALPEGGPSCEPGPDPTCNDCTTNGDETDIDCGGDACLPCGVARGCLTGAYCVSGDCDGALCAAGSPGVACFEDSDCASSQCGPGNCWLGTCCQ